MTVKLVYFAWVREQIGKSEEHLDLPQEVVTVSDLLKYLAGLGENYAQALRFADVIRVAINQEHVEHDTAVAGASEIALFPPMTGG
ncbi:molybdopterin converting factor subunit 1 [Pseudochrobactrum sp. sp1633]|uniref:molybdopterin converting factor subunit 1 n=1 Tax=Pseudochrobactrum sp. sp1633 TaxID=3036706 RepID=UPI0025A5B546|nr:molybdopterin converting factor subunit 1 [Pseudochrobactrum sp. sp1633]MDM8346198.1 molybdopterin converting factor subunit 1 [Pseudochrobactrum sp. sp1633]HWD13737.1 molybdopterin converting factor subunit 1 [Pseudochrobactrum sp.]